MKKITEQLVREIHAYISTSPTGDVPFDKVFRMLAQLEQLEPIDKEENKS